MTVDESWMQQALEEARQGRGLTSPNPCVGAVIVKDGAMLSRGWHQRAGGPHAEVEAIRAAERLLGAGSTEGATIFITLEPCSTHGRTPPCVQALMAGKFARVVWGVDDPNPAHAGSAAAVLEAAGISVARHVLEQECREVIAPFAKFITTGLPWVIAKAGMSLDGRITRPTGEGPWITSEAARADAMQLRVMTDAIIVGAGTVRADDPALTLRGDRIPEGKTQPWRVVLTRSGDLPTAAKVFTDDQRERTLVFRDQSFAAVLRDLAGRGVVTVLIEGGGKVLAEAFSAGLVDEAVVYIAPLVSGTGLPVVNGALWRGGSVDMECTDVKRTGPDVRLELRRKAER